METHICRVEMPIDCTTDNRGTAFVVGQRVAYNRSGIICIGYIESINRNEWRFVRPGPGDEKWWSLYFEMIIRHESDEYKSKIVNPNSFVVL